MLQGVGLLTKQSENSELGYNKLPCNISSLLKVLSLVENFVPYDRNIYKFLYVVYEKPEGYGQYSKY
jgi:hypothetical protein